MRTIYVVGAPGAGKTMLVREVREALDPLMSRRMVWRQTADGRRLNPLVADYFPLYSVVTLGIYDDSPYGGTDRLGLNVAPVAAEFLRKLAERPDAARLTVLGEGDRLAIPTFLDAATALGTLTLLSLEVPADVLEARRAGRANDADGAWLQTASKMFHGKPRRATRDQGQDATWLKGRLTKVDNLVKRYPTTATPHATTEHSLQAQKWLLERIMRNVAERVG